MHPKTDKDREKRIGVWYAVSAFGSWGLLPLYWKALKAVPSTEIMGHRIIWSCVLIFTILTLQKRLSNFRSTYASWRNRLYSMLSAVFIGANWFIYIWAVNANHVVESSMGYFINPLVSVLLGVVFLKERLTPPQTVSVGLAFCGVISMALRYGQIPWIALSLAFTFAIYGLLRKTSYADSMSGLAFETAVLSPAALLYLILQGESGVFGSAGILIHVLLLFSSVVTAAPLICFAHAARRIPLATVGFIQYLAPSMFLVLGVFVFHEPFTPAHLLSFGLIWIALGIYSLSHTKLLKWMKWSSGRRDNDS